ncbi:hypothetical protein E4P39_02580 [Blastococcus sp. CT_GayMR19]|uniref:hypothetical protein n=1 Tax=Blastococcus sp. CT_GayMR19 TaxID=2559608 RepID=UPI00107466E5|nr:hypothetical protein [Blastococcus sp. CT_GayMR19]TFV78149.1 hypothetical protein E4P39_02580 [Blastococcus sp. CT_GayMR19]
MAWTMGALGAWYGLAVVVAVLGLAAERREQGESTSSSVRAAVQRLRNGRRALADRVGPVTRNRFAAAD